MGKSKKNRAAATNQLKHKSQTSAEAFSFGDPVPVLDRRELLDYVECVQTDRWYEPPVSFDGLARTFRAAVYSRSAVQQAFSLLGWQVLKSTTEIKNYDGSTRVGGEA